MVPPEYPGGTQGYPRGTPLYPGVPPENVKVPLGTENGVDRFVAKRGGDDYMGPSYTSYGTIHTHTPLALLVPQCSCIYVLFPEGRGSGGGVVEQGSGLLGPLADDGKRSEGTFRDRERSGPFVSEAGR